MAPLLMSLRMVFRLCFAAAASLLGSGCATSPARTPIPATFVADIRAGRVDLATYDFARKGYWNRSADDRILWLADVEHKLGALAPDINKGCGHEVQRTSVAMMYLILLVQASDGATWSANAKALRIRLAQLDASLRATAPKAGHQQRLVAELKARVAHDQAVRILYDEQSSQGLPPLAAGLWGPLKTTRMSAVDCDNTAWLRMQMQQIGWFDIPTYGEEADHDAWLLVQHADLTPDFQRSTLAHLEGLPPGRTNIKNLAFLWDRIASGEGRPQRYGTQGHCAGPGSWQPNPSEDPAHLDERRMQVGLNPEAEREKEMKDKCSPTVPKSRKCSLKTDYACN
jgi:hypothetical protein